MTQKRIKVLFLHHSTGANLIREGNVRELLKRKNSTIDFWDHSYNLTVPSLYKITSRIFPHHTGLTNNRGELTGKDFHIPNDNTNPDGFAKIFDQVPNLSTTFGRILQFDLTMFKSCYPVTKIVSDAQLNTYKKEYWKIAKIIDTYPNKLFIALTPPPLRAELTTSQCARRARLFALWLSSKEFVGNRKNLVTFDLFNLLTQENSNDERANTLKRDYCRGLSFDSHPNTRANQEIAPLFVDCITQSVQNFFASN